MQTHAVTDTAQELLYDGCRFIQRNTEIIRSWPMHVHYSALPLVPRNTALFRTYGKPDAGRVQIICGVEDMWSPMIAVLRGHSDGVACITFSPDASHLASASDDKTLRLWNGTTGAHITTLEGHSAAVNFVTFSASGSRLASASADGTIRLWDAKTGAHIASLEGHFGKVVYVTFSADDSRIASASGDQSARLWDGKTGAHFYFLFLLPTLGIAAGSAPWRSHQMAQDLPQYLMTTQYSCGMARLVLTLPP
jgi:WD40 repeat protein